MSDSIPKHKSYRSPASSPERGGGNEGSKKDTMRQKETVSGLVASVKSAPDPSLNLSKIKRNTKGGVLVSPQELQSAFTLLDPEKTGSVTLKSLQKSLSIFYPEMTKKEYKLIMNNNKEMTYEEIESLIVDNEIANFDPTVEAFKAYDPKGLGFINEDKMRAIFAHFGLGELSDEEYDIINSSIDVDGDGVISLDDFRTVIDNEINVIHQLAKRNSLVGNRKI
jgi:Ca2+-binding EF-hand superfamily protein